jgi:hypothetical protein
MADPANRSRFPKGRLQNFREPAVKQPKKKLPLKEIERIADILIEDRYVEDESGEGRHYFLLKDEEKTPLRHLATVLDRMFGPMPSVDFGDDD